MFHDFTHRQIACMVDGESERVILSRETKATTVMGKEYVYNGLFAPSSIVKLGGIVQTNDMFLVLTIRQTIEGDKYCSLIKTNALIQVQRYSRQYDDKYNPISIEFVPVEEKVTVFAQYVTAQLRQEEPGLLPSTSYVLQLQTEVDVRKPQDPELISPDRVILDGRPYQVDVVDRVKYPNLLHVQLSEDTR